MTGASTLRFCTVTGVPPTVICVVACAGFTTRRLARRADVVTAPGGFASPLASPSAVTRTLAAVTTPVEVLVIFRRVVVPGEPGTTTRFGAAFAATTGSNRAERRSELCGYGSARPVGEADPSTGNTPPTAAVRFETRRKSAALSQLSTAEPASS